MELLASVIIPTRNRAGTLDQTVRSLWRQTIDPRRFEIVVIDNASTDDTAQCVERLGATSPVRLRYHRLETDRGPAGARNQGARLATGAAFLFLDSDVELDPGWIAGAVGYLERNPGTGIVAGKLLYAAHPARVNMFGGELSRIGLAWDAHEGRLSDGVCNEEERLWAPSAAVMIRREMLERIGLFDDTFYFGFEDSDLGWRANLAGFRCGHGHGVEAQHLGRTRAVFVRAPRAHRVAHARGCVTDRGPALRRGPDEPSCRLPTTT